MRARVRADLVVWLFFAVCAMSVTPALAQQTKEGPDYEERAAALDTEIRAFIEDAQEYRVRAEAAEGSFARILAQRSEDAGLVAIGKVHDLSLIHI